MNRCWERRQSQFYAKPKKRKIYNIIRLHYSSAENQEVSSKLASNILWAPFVGTIEKVRESPADFCFFSFFFFFSWINFDDLSGKFELNTSDFPLFYIFCVRCAVVGTSNFLISMHSWNRWKTYTMPIVLYIIQRNHSRRQKTYSEQCWAFQPLKFDASGSDTYELWWHCRTARTHSQTMTMQACTLSSSFVRKKKLTCIGNSPFLDAAKLRMQCVHDPRICVVRFCWRLLSPHTWRLTTSTTYHIALIQICVMNNSIDTNTRTTWWLHVMTFGFSEIRLFHATTVNDQNDAQWAVEI